MKVDADAAAMRAFIVEEMKAFEETLPEKLPHGGSCGPESGGCDGDCVALAGASDVMRRYARLLSGTAGKELLAERDALRAERDEARAWVEKLTATDRVLTCVYCGHTYPPGTPAHGSSVLTEHIAVCEKHPMAKMFAENAVLKGQVVAANELHERLLNALSCARDVVKCYPEMTTATVESLGDALERLDACTTTPRRASRAESRHTLNVVCPWCGKATVAVVEHGGAIVSQYTWAVGCTLCKKTFTVAIRVSGQQTEAQSDFMERFAAHQASRDRDQEWRDYLSTTALRLMDHDGKPVLERPLAKVPGWREASYALQWRGRHYRINAIVPRGIIPGAMHAFANEIVADEITEAEPLRDYERDEPPFQLQSEESESPHGEVN